VVDWGPLARLKGYLRTGFILRSAGATLSSILGYPIRRRALQRAQITLTSGQVLVAPANEPLLTVFEEVWARRSYLPPEISIARDATIVDIGANVGAFTVLAAPLVPDGRVVAVEPSIRMRTWLDMNIAVNRIRNITVIGCAVAGRSGRSTLYSRGPGVMNTLYMADNYGSSFMCLEEVQSLSLDDLFASAGVTDCALLKLDAEGAEYEILLNASAETLRRIRAIAGEYHVGLTEYKPGALAAHLEAHGFRTRFDSLVDVESAHFFAWRDPAHNARGQS
jgi:FkbM family methyltransferase